ncbi:MAG TPA: prolyl oligopeptidase family serine peptidase, partial [Candidatus Kapabacteria bacterium]|nr:prolyl oligopeptidase family serine peptidase [Candidatus Kapabacteria bacterium]
YPHRYAGVVTICASMYSEGKVIDNLKNLRKYGMPALVMHSIDDPVVPFQTGELLAAAMQNEKIDVEFFSYQGGHWINNEALENLKTWIKSHLPK